MYLNWCAHLQICYHTIRAQTTPKSSSTFKEVFINPDLSFKERQAQRELRKELAARKQKGETGIFICRGRIVKQSKPNNNPPITVMEHQNA